MTQHDAVRAAVFSAGSWGTAAAKIMADAGTDVVLHARRSEVADAINVTHRNPGYFPDVELPSTVTATTSPAAALDGADLLVLSIPAQSLRECLAAWTPYIGADTLIVSSMKGIERDTGRRASEVITEVTGLPAERVAVLSGPNLAREIMAGQPAAATVACPDETAVLRVQQACHTGQGRAAFSSHLAHGRHRRVVPFGVTVGDGSVVAAVRSASKPILSG